MMKINKQHLLEALEIVKPGLASKETIEQAQSFAFLKGRVATYNDSISISHPVEGLEELHGAIEAEHLYKILGKLKQEEIEIEKTEKEIILKSGRAKAGLTFQKEITLPINENLAEKLDWKPLPENFSKLLSFAISSCSRNNSEPILNCVNVTDEGLIESSDSYRITQCRLSEKMPVNTFLIPGKNALQVVKLNPVSISEGKGWVHFKTENETVISCRTLEEKFPEISKHIIVKGVQVTLPATINEVLDRAMVFAKRDSALSEMVSIEIGERQFKISSEAEAGWFEETLNLRYEGEKVKISVTPYLLRDILKETQSCTIGKDRLKFEGDNWVYISLLRGK